MNVIRFLAIGGLVFASNLALADTKVMLPDDERFARDEQPFIMETTIPGDFSTPEGIVGALLTLADQPANPKLSNPFTPKTIASTSSGAGASPLFVYYRGTKRVGDDIVISFSEDGMRYLNNTVSIQESVKGAIEGTLRLHFPEVKTIQYEIGGVIVTEWDA